MKLKLAILVFLVFGCFLGYNISKIKSNNTINNTEEEKSNIDNNETTNNENYIPNIIDDTNPKINIYLFWGDGCPHCEHLISFLDSISDNYGKYYNIIKYEVWHNEDNKKLMDQVGNVLDEEPRGVPYLIIGDQSISGYSSSKDEYIKKIIVEEYNKNDHFDVLKKIK